MTDYSYKVRLIENQLGQYCLIYKPLSYDSAFKLIKSYKTYEKAMASYDEDIVKWKEDMIKTSAKSGHVHKDEIIIVKMDGGNTFL